MKPRQATPLGRCLVRFFQEYLPALRGLSRHTIHSYRDSLVLFLQFTARDAGRPVEALDIADVTADRVERFLASLETERHNGIATRNCQWRMKFRQHGRSKIPQFGRAVISRQGDRNSCLWAGDRAVEAKAAGVRAV